MHPYVPSPTNILKRNNSLKLDLEHNPLLVSIVNSFSRPFFPFFALSAWNNVLYTQDLCPVRPTLLDKVWRYNHIDRRQDHCYIVQPEVQRVALAQCGDGL